MGLITFCVVITFCVATVVQSSHGHWPVDRYIDFWPTFRILNAMSCIFTLCFIEEFTPNYMLLFNQYTRVLHIHGLSLHLSSFCNSLWRASPDLKFGVIPVSIIKTQKCKTGLFLKEATL
jgi:hypothetical protein